MLEHVAIESIAGSKGFPRGHDPSIHIQKKVNFMKEVFIFGKIGCLPLPLREISE